MKKLMIAAAIVCAAVASQAAAINWKTGMTIKPDGTTTAAANTLSLCVFLVSQDTYDKTALTSIWNSYGDVDVEVLKAGATYKNTGAGAAGVTAAQPSDAVLASTTYYALIISAYDADNDGNVDMYAVNKSSITTNGSGSPQGTTNNNLAKYIGGGTSGTAVTWESVPEPTSAMLLLLGMAGLALRRKQA